MPSSSASKPQPSPNSRLGDQVKVQHGGIAPSAPNPSSRVFHESRKSAPSFSFRQPFRPNANPSSTTVVPSTAEGKPIPVDDSTVQHRTSALRELNNNYPSRHRYAKSTGAQSSTYSEPVIVRSYYSPHPTRPENSTRRRLPGGSRRIAGSARSVAASDVTSVVSAARRALPFPSQVTAAGNGLLSAMARAGALKPPASGQPDAQLPPLEAFSFKSFLANVEAQGSNSNINADLDRIAEICAKSRYSLSNQYEVHYAPHGSGSNFLRTASRDDNQGPTLQAVTSDDDQGNSNSTHRKRRMGARRNSRAMGTLETIMSSSRSSDEDKSKKKPAAELAEQVRGRATRKASGDSSPATSSPSPSKNAHSQNEESSAKALTARRPSSIALIDNLGHATTPADTSNPRTPAASLVGDIALPQASNSQLELRTAPDAPSANAPPVKAKDKTKIPQSDRRLSLPSARGAISNVETSTPGISGLFTSLSGWMPWRSSDTSDNKPPGRAEGSLRELLKTSSAKSKSTEGLL